MIDLARSLNELHGVWTQAPGIEKTPSDLDRYEILIERVKPQILIETGLHYGGSARWFSERVPEVIVVEIDLKSCAAFDPPENVTVIHGDSVESAGRVAELCDAEPVMVVLDSDHGTDTVYGEMVAYGPLVTRGSYMVVEDGIYHHLPPGPRWCGNWYDGDPVVAISRYLFETGREWEIDWTLEDMFPTTQHPMGWLRRT